MCRRPAAVVAVVLALCAGRASAGRYPVGVTTLAFTKPSVTTGAPRALATVVWYPAAPHGGTPEALGLRDADVRRGRFPLVVFSHGACGRPTEASYFTMALASLGFVVAAPPHPGDTGGDLPGCLSVAETADSAVNRVPDVRYVIDAMLAQSGNPYTRFSGRLRPTAIGMTGLSFGGFTTLFAELEEPRIRAAVAMVPGGTSVLGTHDLAIPTMIIGSERDQVVGFAESEHAFAHLVGPRFLVELLAAGHLSVTDDCAPLCVPQGVSQDEAHRLVLRYAMPFLQRYLAGHHGARVPGPTSGVMLTAEPRPRPASGAQKRSG